MRDTGATLRIAANFQSPGERCTWDAIVRHRKPHAEVKLHDHFFREPHFQNEVDRIVAWLVEGDWPTVNVAGNSEWTSPGIGARAHDFLVQVLGTVMVKRVSP